LSGIGVDDAAWDHSTFSKEPRTKATAARAKEPPTPQSEMGECFNSLLVHAEDNTLVRTGQPLKNPGLSVSSRANWNVPSSAPYFSLHRCPQKPRGLNTHESSNFASRDSVTPTARDCITAPEDVVEFESNPRRPSATIVGKQSALVFVPCEAKHNSASAADKGAQREETKRRDDAHSVLL
jgi:hypothetical protein